MNDLQPVNLRSIWKGEEQHFRTYDGRLCNYSMGMLDAVLGETFHRAPIAEKAAFLAYCINNGLDPLRKQVYFVKYQVDQPAAYVTSWEVFLDRAQRHPQFDGFENGVIWLVPDADHPTTKDQPQVMRIVHAGPCDYVADANHKISGGWAVVYRKDQEHPRRVDVPLEEMIARNRSGEPTKFWAKMPTTMATKTPTARALRQAFPSELQGLYVEQEVREFQEATAPQLTSGETLPAEDLDSMAAELDRSVDGQAAETPAADNVTAEP